MSVKFTRTSPSPRYVELLSLYRKMHAEGYVEKGDRDVHVPPEQTFRGSQLPKFVHPIKELIDCHSALSILDYGAGKGHQYGPLALALPSGETFPDIKSFWAVDQISCYDPAVPGVDVLPNSSFDGVVCTDVLEHCPVEDIPWIVKELFDHATKFVFANIACYPAKKTLPSGENAHCTVRHPEWWGGLFTAISDSFPDIDYELNITAHVKNAEGVSELQMLRTKRQ